jgi:hypothetical protein
MFGLLTGKDMILDGIVAKPTRIPALAVCTLEFDIAAIVFAAQMTLLLLLVVVRRGFGFVSCPPPSSV